MPIWTSRVDAPHPRNTVFLLRDVTWLQYSTERPIYYTKTYFSCQSGVQMGYGFVPQVKAFRLIWCWIPYPQGGDKHLPGCRIQFLMVSLFHWVTLKNTYIQHEGVWDTVYTKCVALDGMEISWPTSTVWLVLLNSTFTWPKINYTIELCLCFFLCSHVIAKAGRKQGYGKELSEHAWWLEANEGKRQAYCDA